MTAEDSTLAPLPERRLSRITLFDAQRYAVKNDLSTNEICILFDEFLVEFEKMELSGQATTETFLNAVEEITDIVLLIPPSKLLDPKVLSHSLMLFFHQMLTDILANWQASRLRLNIQETDVFLKIVLIFIHAGEQASGPNADEDRKRITNLLASRRYLSLLRVQIIDNIENKDGINDDPNICTLGLLTTEFLKDCPFYYNVEQNQSLIEGLIMNCLDSYDYAQALRQLQHGEQLTHVDRFLLFTCWNYIPFVAKKPPYTAVSLDWNKFVQDVYDRLLTQLERALDEPPPVAPPSFAYIFERCHQLLNIHNLSSFETHANHIIDYLTKILQNSQKTNVNDEEFITIALDAFYNLSKNADIRAIMKKRNLFSLFNKYASVEMGEKRKIVFTILAETVDEQDIHNLPSEIPSIFIEQIKQYNSTGDNPDVDSALSCLKTLMQHESMKNEFIKLDGVEAVISFIRDSDSDKRSDTQLEDALAILWSCTFNNPEILKRLQQDKKLMTQVNQLLDKAKQDQNSALEKVAEGVIWKVEKEEKFKEEQAAEQDRKKQEKKRKAQQSGAETVDEEEEEEEEYDCMISYSWADMDLVNRLAKHLTEKLGYKIWLDQEQMHGSTIQAMANAVESAQFFLMCMSETYKRSANCQSEAEYAFNRKKHIVPCKLKAEYTPDGWLGFILGSRMYIDFGRYDFDKAVDQLHHEIELQKKRRKDAKAMAKAEKAAADSDHTKDAVEDLESFKKVRKTKVDTDVSTWSEEDVRNFLLKHNLSSMIPLCNGINGEELANLYAMCKINSVSMFRSLKFELLRGHHRILPISTYLRFISHMRAICEDEISSNAQITMKTDENELLIT